MSRPDPTEYAPFYAGYVSHVPEGDILSILEQGAQTTASLLQGLSPSQADFRYAPGKWSIKEVLGHITDAERIFAYRALRFSRGDQTPVPGFEQEGYIQHANFAARPLSDLIAEFATVRQATLFLFRNLDDDAWQRRGTASGAEVSVRALAYITAGHEIHHRDILKRRYL
jgi:uncharacterized damage-inducible protein DinB